MNILAFNIGETLMKLVQDSGFAGFFADGGWRNLVMIAIACVLLYLGIVKKFEPLLLVGIAFGCLLTNLPVAGLYNPTCGRLHNGTAYHPGSGDVFRTTIPFTATVTSVERRPAGHLLHRRQGRPVSVPHLHGRRRDDRLWPPDRQTRRACCSARRPSWACSSPSSARSASASPARRPLPSASSAARTARRPSS